MLRYLDTSIHQEVIKKKFTTLVPGTRRGMFLQRIGSLKTVPEKFANKQPIKKLYILLSSTTYLLPLSGQNI